MHRSSTLAVTSLVLSLLGLVVFGLFAIAGVVVGHMARARIKRGEASGNGLATAGLVIGYIAIAINALVLVLLAAGVITWSDLGL